MSAIQFNNFDTTTSYRQLQKLAATPILLRQELNSERVRSYQVAIGDILNYNYAAKKVNEAVMTVLQQLAEEQQLLRKYQLLLNGEIMNTGEKRKVLHQLTRVQLGDVVLDEGTDLRNFYLDQQKNIKLFSEIIHSGELKGSTGKAFTNVVQVGIGGSDLGPRALYLALKNYVKQEKGKQRMNAFFISNVDPDDANEILSLLDFETTLFILVSKSGTTQETLTNEMLVREYVKKANIPGFDINKHFIAITSATSPLATSSAFLTSFFMNDYIGGRFSSTSPVGGAVLSLAFGAEIFERLLTGAAIADNNALNRNIRENAALLDALIGVWERNFLGYPATAVLPYSQALSRFPAHLQQMDMESNGKSVNRAGEPLNYVTGPIIFGEPGTNGQHSFYQLLHQGTDVVPLQFIGFLKPQFGNNFSFDGSTSQAKLNANLVAQIVAFARGKDDVNPNKNFLGERPSSLIFSDRLTPEFLGALLAHYENKVMFQGLIWNVNSFDQEGVQLGKVLTSQVLKGIDQLDPVLKEYARLMQVL